MAFFKTVDFMFEGVDEVKQVVTYLLDQSRWFRVVPLPDDEYRVEVKEEIAKEVKDFLKRRCECGGLGFDAFDVNSTGKFEIQRCDDCSCEKMDDNQATKLARNMALAGLRLYEEAEFVLAMYQDQSEEALCSSIENQLKEAVKKFREAKEIPDA
jgi:hypothetical protein